MIDDDDVVIETTRRQPLFDIWLGDGKIPLCLRHHRKNTPRKTLMEKDMSSEQISGRQSDRGRSKD
jgi:hypothetical protein